MREQQPANGENGSLGLFVKWDFFSIINKEVGIKADAAAMTKKRSSGRINQIKWKTRDFAAHSVTVTYRNT